MGSNVVEQVEAYHHLQPHPLQTNPDNQSSNLYSDSTLSPPERSKGHLSSANIKTDHLVAPMSGLSYEFPPNFGPSPSWGHSTFQSNSPQSLAIERPIQEEGTGTIWRPSGSPMPGAYPLPQFSMHSSSLSITPSSQGSREAFFPHGTRDDRSWQPPPAPIRSMSLVTPEELPPHYQARFLSQPPNTVGRVPATAEATAHTLYTHAAQGAAAYEPHANTEINPLGHPGRTGQPAGFGFPQWGTYPQQSIQMVESGREGFSREWYTGSPNLAQVREEDGSPHHYQHPSRSSHHRQNPG